MLSAVKYPYLKFDSSMILEIVKSKDLSIVFPDTVKVKEGESLTQNFTITNIGQTDLYNLNISLTGVPSEYYTLTDKIEKLKVGEEKTVSVYFSVPYNISLGTYSATLKVFNEDLSKEKIFGFTIVGQNQTTTVPTTGISGKIVLPEITPDLIYILMFAAVVFTLAFLLKRRKVRKQRRYDFKNLLFEIKNHIKKNEISSFTKLQKPAPSILVGLEKSLQDTSRIVEEKNIG